MESFFNKDRLIISSLSVSIVFASAFVINLISKFLRNRIGGNIVNYATFPGVIIHELSHAFFATITGAKVVEMKLFKFDQSDGCSGYVRYINRGNWFLRCLQDSLSSCGPIIIGSLLIYIGLSYIRPNYLPRFNFVVKILFYYLLVSIALHIELSNADLLNMKAGILLVFALLIVIFYIFRIDLFMPLKKLIIQTSHLF